MMLNMAKQGDSVLLPEIKATENIETGILSKKNALDSDKEIGAEAAKLVGRELGDPNDELDDDVALTFPQRVSVEEVILSGRLRIIYVPRKALKSSDAMEESVERSSSGFQERPYDCMCLYRLPSMSRCVGCDTVAWT